MAAAAGGGPIMWRASERLRARWGCQPMKSSNQSQEREKKKSEGRGNEEIGSCVKVAERNQSSERRITTSNNGFIFYWRSICCCHI